MSSDILSKTSASSAIAADNHQSLDAAPQAAAAAITDNHEEPSDMPAQDSASAIGLDNNEESVDMITITGMLISTEWCCMRRSVMCTLTDTFGCFNISFYLLIHVT